MKTNTNLITHICNAVKIINNADSADEMFQSNADLTAISRKLKLTKTETVLFCMFMEMSDDKSIRVRDIARQYNLSIVETMKILDDITGLLEKGYVVRKVRNDGAMEYYVPDDVINSIRENKPYTRKVRSQLPIEEFFQEMSDIYCENQESSEELEMNLGLLINNNQHLEFCKMIRANSWHLNSANLLLLVFFCNRQVNYNDDHIRESDWEDFFSRATTKRFSNQLGNGTSQLVKEELVQPKIEGEMGERKDYCLTTKAKETLLSELSGLFTKRAFKSENIRKHTTLSEKKLFYNEAEEKQIGQLASFIDDKSFREVQKRLEDNGMRKGFCCLFYGSPGTGKTETVYQLAKKTKRDLYVIDVSKIKSCWVGESEKNITKAFEDYKLCVKQNLENNTPAPILLFNEADAVLGIRQEGASRAVDKMENSIQNIILQGMEDLEGIMIATTNLTQNLDKAFERRFLYKVKFEKPTLKAKEAIWKSMIPSLKKKDISILAAKYDFSGGQIENIARKRTIQFVLTGKEVPFEEIDSFCQNEIMESKSRKIGFGD